jgi:uncharacterized protein (TIGR01370 family)
VAPGEKSMRRTILQAFITLIATGCKPTPGWLATKAASAGGVNWIVFYGETADEQMLSAYDLVVLDPMFKGSIAAIAQTGARLCGYLSLGEIRTADPNYGRLDSAVLLEENPAWPSTRRIDIRHPAWKDLVLNEIIPAVVEQGFTGLLLDTLDTPPYLERQDPDGNRGMRQAAIDLVGAIRRTYPEVILIMNRGYELLPYVADQLDGIVVESLLTTTHANGYKWNEQPEIALQLSLLGPAVNRRDHLPILSLDYWAPEDVATIRQIYLRERKLGHHPYVATRLLDKIIPRPAEVVTAS